MKSTKIELSAQDCWEDGIYTERDYYNYINKDRKIIKALRWSGTICYLIGMSLTSLNIYPINLIFGALGGILWFSVGRIWRDNAMCVAEGASFVIYFSGLILLMFK